MNIKKITATYHISSNGFGYISFFNSAGEKETLTGIVDNRNDVFDGDTVSAAIQTITAPDGSVSKKIKITEILNRAKDTIVGVYLCDGQKRFVMPYYYIPFRVPVKSGDFENYNHGDLVLAKLNSFKSVTAIKATPIMNFSSAELLDSNARALIYNNKILMDISDDAVEEGIKLSSVSADSFISQRQDYRSKNIFTLSASLYSPRHHAFSINKTDSGYTLGIYVSDTAEFVAKNSAIDEEARLRGRACFKHYACSPMLPRALINSVLNFNDNQSKLAIGVFIHLNNSGHIVDCEFTECIIKPSVHAYHEDTDSLFINADPSAVMPLRTKYSTIYDQLELLFELAAKRKSIKNARGVPDFYETVTLFEAAEQNEEISRSYIEKASETSMVIKELFITAGEAVAQKMNKTKTPCLYFYRKERLFHYNEEAPLNLKILPSELDLSESGYFEKAIDFAEKNNAQLEIYKLFTYEFEFPRFSSEPVFDYYYKTSGLVRFLHPVTEYSSLVAHRIIKAFIHGKTAEDEINSYLTDILPLERNVDIAEKKILRMFEIETARKEKGTIYTAKALRQMPEGLYAITSTGLLGVIPNEFINQTIPPLSEISVRTTETSFNGPKLRFEIVSRET
ncbi:RNB domain-containing ribonuclease [Eubacteriales bacterium OttesenSCG-928-G02]|nr:RNB domain-containing ribonuclease [Eubacteriales bacterium OttesenSCG-928-G02]